MHKTETFLMHCLFKLYIASNTSYISLTVPLAVDQLIPTTHLDLCSSGASQVSWPRVALLLHGVL